MNCVDESIYVFEEDICGKFVVVGCYVFKFCDFGFIFLWIDYDVFVIDLVVLNMEILI